MTECNSKPIAFSSLARRQVVADFAGGAIVSDAGTLLLREIDRKLGLVEKLDVFATRRQIDLPHVQPAGRGDAEPLATFQRLE